MNLLYRIVYAAHATGTHHKLALDALRHLKCTDADRWQRLFLVHAKEYLEGSKAPDNEFKDFKNHVLHTRDGYWGGAPDLLAMRVFDVLFAFPPILLAIALVAALGPSTVNLVLTIAVLTLPQFAMLTRSATLALKPQDFVQAARALGASHGRILGAHLLPNITPTLAVQTSLSLSIVILVEAALSFLGLGTQPPAPSWGSMLSRGRQYMTIAPWLVLAPGLAIMLAVLGFNLLGDAQRDLLDPRRAGAGGRNP